MADDGKKQEHDVDGLLRKNAELLAEVKRHKGRIAELEGERDAAKQAADEARETMQRVQLDEPLEARFDDVFTVPWRIARPLLEEHFTFALGDDGKPRVTSKASEEELPINNLLGEMATIPDLAAAMHPPRGGGAPGTCDRSAAGRTDTKEKRKVAPEFGLR